MKIRPLSLFVAALCLFSVSACGGDSLLSEEERNLAARMSDTFPLGSADVPVLADESNCIATKVVGDIGGERLASDYGVTRETIAEGRNPWQLAFKVGDAELIADSSMDCIDWNRFLSDRFTASGIPEDTAACMAKTVDLSLIEQQAVNSYQGKPPASDIENALDDNFAAAGSSCSS